MLLVRDIMTADVVALSPETTLRDAMEMLARRHLSGAPVIADGGGVVGVVSSTDLMELAAGLPGASAERGEEEDEWEEAPAWTEGVTAPAAYFADLWTVARDATGEPRPGAIEWNALEEHTVAEAMTAGRGRAVAPAATVVEAAEIMRRAGVHRLLVVEGGTLLGLVSTMDITRAVAQRRLGTGGGGDHRPRC